MYFLLFLASQDEIDIFLSVVCQIGKQLAEAISRCEVPNCCSVEHVSFATVSNFEDLLFDGFCQKLSPSFTLFEAFPPAIYKKRNR